MKNNYKSEFGWFAALLVSLLLTSGLTNSASAQVRVFSDDFSTSQGLAYTTNGNIGSTGWFITRSGADWGGRIHDGQLQLTNTASDASNAHGWVFASVDASEDFSAEYQATLDQNTDAVVWLFNMRQITDNPSGFSSNGYGAAFILAADSRNVATEGKGYAVVLGNNGRPDPVRLVAFEGGLQSIGSDNTGLIVAGAPLDDPRDNHFSVKVIYNPDDNSWQMFGRVDGTSFSDPLGGELVSVGSVINDTHTSDELGFTGAYWQGLSTSDQTAFYDNVTVQIDEDAVSLPKLFASPLQLSGFSYEEGEGPSAPQSFELTGSDLDGTTVSAAASSGFEVAASATGPYQSSVDLAGYDGAPKAIYVRLAANQDEGVYTGEVTVTGGGHTDNYDALEIALSGEVLPAPIPPASIASDGYVEDFDGFLGTGFSLTPDAGQLHSGNWRITGMSDGDGSFDGTYESGDFARGTSTGGVTTGGIYAFDTGDGVTILGVQPTASDFTPGAFTLRLGNTTGRTINYLDVSYDIFTYNDQNRASSFNFAWSLDDAAYNSVPELNYVTPEAADASPEWEKTERSTRLSGLNLAAGDFVYLQWRSNDAGGDGARDEFGLTNVTVDAVQAVEIAGSSGWRMLSVPVTGATVGDLAAQNQVQGIGGISSFYGGAAPDGIETDPPNIFTSYEQGWIAPAHVSSGLEIGKGLIWYFYDNDIGVSTALPFTLALGGNTAGSDVTVGLHASAEPLPDGENNGGTVDAAFNMLGNPFASDLDISNLAEWVSGGSLNSAIVQVWKNDEAGWQEGIGHQGEWVLIGGGNNDDKVAAWQGFMIENDDASEIAFPASAQTDGATFHKEQKPAFKRLAFTLEGENAETGTRTRDGVNLVFSDRAEAGWDLLDATQLTPLTGTFATLSFVGERNGRTVLKVQESRPAEFEGAFEVPVAMHASSMSGDFAISWEGLDDLPSDWQFTLIDNRTGQRVNLREVEDYAFLFESAAKAPAKRTVGADAGTGVSHVAALQPAPAGDEEAGDEGIRFTLVVSSEPLSSEIPGDVPQEFELSQNYPNPFNPATVISYNVPEQAHIRITVYDMLGREIAILVNEQKGPGSYDVHWDATEFSSGMYLYRLESGSKSITRRMTLIK